jgi:hypothetical protein
MYIAETIQDEFFGTVKTPLVAWDQQEDPSLSQLDSDMTSSLSNRYFQDGHPSMTLKNVFSIAPRFEDYTYTAWASDVDYSIGDIRSKNNINYRCIQSYTIAGDGAQDPEAVDSEYWSVWTVGNQYSVWLRKKTRGYILSVLDDFLEQKQWGKVAKSIIEERALFDGAQYEESIIESESKTVGFEIHTAKYMGVLAKIHEIGLQFSSAGTFDIKLYHSSQASPIATQSVTIANPNTMEWFVVDWDLPYLSQYDSGGAWTVEYDQSEAPGNAVNKARDWSYSPAYGSGYSFESWKLWSQYLEFHPFKVSTAQRSNPGKRVHTYTENYGINMVVSVHCDYTSFFVRQKKMFQNAIVKGVAKKMLREIALNPNGRINLGESNQNISKDELLYEIDGNTDGKRATGIGYEYKQALEALKIDTQGLTKLCLPCGRKGVKIKTIG